jgi:hypothetical protein
MGVTCRRKSVVTILVSSLSNDLIVMLSDSVLTVTHRQEGGDAFNEYERGTKYYRFPGIGCITTWGDHTYNQLGRFMERAGHRGRIHSVAELATCAQRYLEKDYRKDAHDELGFHIGGFDQERKPHLYHTFWGFDRPRPAGQEAPEVHMYDHSDWVFLYNGRNDLAHAVMQTLKQQIEAGQEMRFDLKGSFGHIALCDFIARFAAEVTPEVGPPFVLNLIFPDNSIETLEDTSYAPISLQNVARVISRLVTHDKVTVLEAAPELPTSHGMLTGTTRIVPSGLLDDSYRGGTVSIVPPKAGNR